MQLGVNHLGHFLLTDLLLERLKASAPSRVVILSSCFHDKAFGILGEIYLEDLHFQHRPYHGWEAYAQSKLANLLHAKELDRRLEGSGVTAVSVHPGWVRTQLARHTGPIWIQNVLLRPVLSLIGQIGEWDGAQTTLHCLLDDDVPNHGGAYFSQVGIYRDKSCNLGGWPLRSPNPQAHLEDVSSRLWDLSAEAVGIEVAS
jgi:NAD(P)-dependent dehydrogenase (short-subunit alcohol dehydrogenase family)